MAEEEVAALVADNENGLCKVDDALRAVIPSTVEPMSLAFEEDRLALGERTQGWSAPAAVTVVSFLDQTCRQEPVCFASLVRELLKRFFPMTRPGDVLGPNENLTRCHAPVSVERVFSRTLCTFSPHTFRAGKERDADDLITLTSPIKLHRSRR